MIHRDGDRDRNYPFTSLSATNVNGPGTARDLERVAIYHSMVVSLSGGMPANNSWRVWLEASQDSVHWVQLGSVVGYSPVRVYTTAPPLGTPFVARYVRATLESFASSPGDQAYITATIASSLV